MGSNPRAAADLGRMSLVKWGSWSVGGHLLPHSLTPGVRRMKGDMDVKVDTVGCTLSSLLCHKSHGGWFLRARGETGVWELREQITALEMLEHPFWSPVETWS